ncbi:MAG TPA: efflux transporter outer membrane subunit [Candidatus Saccharimonadia bacterium]|nr:efflux transporter outer membrane subunit [Candidatus Saccharimonadia bacterium]
MPDRGCMQGARTIQTRWMMAAVVVSVLSGCMVGPDYQRPVLPSPAVFRGAADATAPSEPTSLGDLHWFEVFKDEQLHTFIQTALVANYDLRDAVARVSAARASLGITQADQFPHIAASADITTVRASRNGLRPVPAGASRERTVGSVLLNLLSFEVDVWGRLRRATEAARAEVLAAEDTRQAVLTTLVSDVATAYFVLLELDKELEIAQRTLALRQQSLQLIEVRRQGGVATLLEVRQAEQLVYSAAQVIPDIERLIEQTENQICLLLGQPPSDVPRGQSLTAQAQPPAVPPGLPSALLERRPDIRAAEQTLIAANANIGVARAAYFPTISLTGLLGYESNQLSSLFKGASSTWQFVPQVSQPIFTAGRITSQVRLAEAQQQRALIAYEKTIQTAFREVADALVQYRRVKEIRTQQTLLVTTLQDRSQLAYMRYRGGVDTLLNALDADRDLFNAELNLTQTGRNELLALVQLYKALGGGWQP